MSELGFFTRLWMAFVCFFHILFRRAFAQQVLPAYETRKALPAGRKGAAPVASNADASGGAPAASTGPATPRASAAAPAPSAVKAPPAPAPAQAVVPHASGLFVLSLLQREGRLVDFLQEEVAPFSDAEVGAAARVVHEGCRKVLRDYLAVEPVLPQGEGDRVTVPAGFDARRIRLTGDVQGEAPHSGALKHHGWAVREVKLPELPQGTDLKVLAPAEVEL